MACGLPVITTDDPGYDIYSLDRDGVLLIEPTADAVRAALRLVATDAARRARMAEYSATFARAHFGWPAHISRLVGEYEAQLGWRALKTALPCQEPAPAAEAEPSGSAAVGLGEL
jgi:glycosyltransferase involved in cell wall biosynthesis